MKVGSVGAINTIVVKLSGQRGDFSLDVSLELPSRGVSALFGRSAVGKTTILRCIAGLERVSSAYISMDGDVWEDSRHNYYVAAHRRAVGYVFQESLLFPHLTVEENIHYGYKRTGRRCHKLEFSDVVDFLQLTSLLSRKPDCLSGGEQKRVAIARALMSSPRLLMMDEPLASLDEKGKQEILPYLDKLHRELDVPMLYVCHSLGEVARLADSLVLIEQGKVVAQGELMEVLTGLHSDALPQGSVLVGQVIEYDARYHLSRVAIPGGELLIGGNLGSDKVRVFVSVSDVSITLEHQMGTSIVNILEAEVRKISHIDDVSSLLILCIGSGRNVSMIKARITRYSCDKLGLFVGRRVYVQIKGISLTRAHDLC